MYLIREYVHLSPQSLHMFRRARDLTTILPYHRSFLDVGIPLAIKARTSFVGTGVTDHVRWFSFRFRSCRPSSKEFIASFITRLQYQRTYLLRY